MKYWRFDGFGKLKFEVKNYKRYVADGYQTVPNNLELSFGVVNCLEVFPNPFNSINSLLKITLNFTPIYFYPRLKNTGDNRFYPFPPAG